MTVTARIGDSRARYEPEENVPRSCFCPKPRLIALKGFSKRVSNTSRGSEFSGRAGRARRGVPPEPVVDVLWLRACALRLLGVRGTWPTEEHTEWEEVASEEIEVEDILNKRKGYSMRRLRVARLEG